MDSNLPCTLQCSRLISNTQWPEHSIRSLTTEVWTHSVSLSAMFLGACCLSNLSYTLLIWWRSPGVSFMINSRLYKPSSRACPLNTFYPHLWLLLHHRVLVAQFSLVTQCVSFPLLHFSLPTLYMFVWPGAVTFLSLHLHGESHFLWYYLWGSVSTPQSSSLASFNSRLI